MKFGRIYILKNTENEKVYIGQTTLTVKERFTQHMKNSTLRQKSNIKLYIAIQNIGKDKFYIETLEDDIILENLDEREMFYIEKYDSFNNGYNSTKGGRGGLALNKTEQDKVLSLACQGMNANELASIYSVNKATIFRTLERMGFKYHFSDIELLRSLVSKGKTNEEISEEIGVDKMTVCRLLDRNGIRKHRKPVKCRSGFDIEFVIYDYKNKMPIDKICEKYNISKNTFYRIKKQFQTKD